MTRRKPRRDDCETCGRALDQSGKMPRRFCPACIRERQRAQRLPAKRAAYRRAHPTAAQRAETCRVCGVPVAPDRLYYCSEKCQAARNWRRNAVRNARCPRADEPPDVATCIVCGADFEEYSHHPAGSFTKQRYCSPVCRNAYWNARGAAKRRIHPSYGYRQPRTPKPRRAPTPLAVLRARKNERKRAQRKTDPSVLAKERAYRAANSIRTRDNARAFKLRKQQEGLPPELHAIAALKQQLVIAIRGKNNG